RPAGAGCSPSGWPATRAGPWPSWTASTTCSSRRPRPCTGSRKRRPRSTTCCGNSPWPRSLPAGQPVDGWGRHMRHPLPTTGGVTPQPPGPTPQGASPGASGETQPQAALRCPGGEDTPSEASEAPAREAIKRVSEDTMEAARAPGAIAVANAPVSYGAFEVTVGHDRNVPDGVSVLHQAAGAGHAGL